MRRSQNLEGLTSDQLLALARDRVAELEVGLATLDALTARLAARLSEKPRSRDPVTPWDRMLVARFGYRPSNRALVAMGGPGMKVLAKIERGEPVQPAALDRLARAIRIPETEIRRIVPAIGRG